MRRGIAKNEILHSDEAAVSIRVVERASEHYGWPLHIIENCADDPAIEQPDAFLRTLRSDSSRAQLERSLHWPARPDSHPS